jgi:cell division septum initiation protein DivIVA
MATVPDPDHIRVPAYLSAADLQRALDELDTKIQTLHRRAHAIVAGSTATYQQHAEALEAKRARLLDMLGRASATASEAAAPASPETGVWDEIRRGVENLRHDLRDLL